MAVIPTIFVSHGSPMTLVRPSPVHEFLEGLAARLPRPQAIVVVSAHWCTPTARVSTAARPPTIHDFYGFPKALYEIEYPAPGAPELAREIAALTGATPQDRGLDHGAWVPLLLAWPNADIPVVGLSVQPDLGPRHHWRLGQALRPLRQRGVLILASGGSTHNLGAYFDDEPAAAERSRLFTDWLADAVAQGRDDDLLDYRARAPHGAYSHPTDEHLLPLFVAMGGGDAGSVLYRGMDGSLGMDAYAWA